MSAKKWYDFSKKDWAIILLVLFVGSYFLVGYWTERPYIERREHLISSYVAVPITENVEWNSWAFTDYSDTQYDKVVSKYDATRRFVMDTQTGLGNKAFVERMLQENLETIKAQGDNAVLADCFNYQKQTNKQGEPYTSVNTWACVFDPTGIKGSIIYMPTITDGVEQK